MFRLEQVEKLQSGLMFWIIIYLTKIILIKLHHATLMQTDLANIYIIEQNERHSPIILLVNA